MTITSSDITVVRSTTDWRAWWRVQAQIDATDWPALHQQHSAAWRQLRTLAQPSSVGAAS